MGKRKLLDGKQRGRSIALATSVREEEEEEERISLWRANSGRDLFPAKLCRHVPRNFFFPPPLPLFREGRGSMVPVFDAERLFILADFFFPPLFIFQTDIFHPSNDDSPRV